MATFNGDKIKITTFGTSHGQSIGAKLENFPHFEFDLAKLKEFLDRRKSTYSPTFNDRCEPDIPIFKSGVSKNAIVSDIVEVEILNKDIKSGDYKNLYARPRPSHADLGAYFKDGRLDFTGGGEFSGRMTALICVAGGIAKQYLKKLNVDVYAYVSSVDGVSGKSYKNDAITDFTLNKDFPSLSEGEKMKQAVLKASKNGDSVGGVIECVALNFPHGIGGELFDGLESKLSALLFAIPAVKGVEFGSGFELSKMYGSTANDEICQKDGKIVTLTNHCGGINGGISNGMPITLSVAVKPTPSIRKIQRSVDLVTGENIFIEVNGRHDACIVPRALVVVEAAVCIGLMDSILYWR